MRSWGYGTFHEKNILFAMVDISAGSLVFCLSSAPVVCSCDAVLSVLSQWSSASAYQE